jgi:ubiquinone/menaquinone biosynthesis C-methylase UbiE
MLDRRTLFGATAAVSSFVAGAVSSPFTAKKAKASIPSDVDVQPRSTVGRLERIPTLALESREDFLTAFRTFVNTDLTRAAKARADRIMDDAGIGAKSPVSREKALELLENDYLVGTRFRAWTSSQRLMWENLYDEFHGNAEKYLAEMEATDNSGPGTLELNPGMDMPNYVKWEIHQQPGGYVGDPFAGHIYHYGTNDFYMGLNDQDQIHQHMARQTPLPTHGDGVQRILDMGCSVGQLSVAMKERFPEAEVWGIDIGAPMVRYAHMRAVDLGVDVNFAQRLAEDTKFPDNHFDIVISYILHHEVTNEASKQIIAEAHRVLKPGGVFYPVDFYTAARTKPKTGWEQVRWWWTHRWNHEVWYYDYVDVDFPAEMKKAGFDVNEEGPNSGRYEGGNLAGIKRA